MFNKIKNYLMIKDQELLKVFNDSQTIYYPTSSWTINKYDIFYPTTSSLWGVYFMKCKEKKNPNLLLRRLIYSRMSSSNLLRTILIVQNGYDIDNNTIKQLERFFDVVFIFNDDNGINKLKRVLSSNQTVKFEIPNKISQREELKRLKLSDMFNEINYNPCNFGKCEFDSSNLLKVHNPFTGNLKTTQLFDFQGQLSFSKDTKSKSFILNYENHFTNVMLNNFSFESQKLEIKNEKICIANTNFNFSDGEIGYNYLNTMLSMGVLPVSVNNNNEFNGLGRLWM